MVSLEIIIPSSVIDNEFDVLKAAQLPSKLTLKRSLSILEKPLSGHWCFNCYHFVETDDVFSSKKHHEYLNDKLELIDSPRQSYLACICLDCVYYRIQKCVKCNMGSPLCMFPLSEWFESVPLNRTCIDCTAVNETKDILKQLENLCASQCILQCNKCCQYKYVCSFSVFAHAYGEKASRVCRDLDICRDQKLYKLMICLECRLQNDIDLYKKILEDRYFEKISKDPPLSPIAPLKITVNKKRGMAMFNELSYAKALKGEDTVKARQFKVDIKTITDKLPKDSSCEKVGPVYFLSNIKGFVCEILLKVLEDEILHLRAKTKLELKLASLPVDIWDDVLQKKMQFTTHMFSLQSSGLSNFHDPESRWAYTAVYTPVHASMVYDIVSEGRLIPLLDIISDACNSSERFHVSCFGCGPGSEVLGLNPFLPNKAKYHLFDNCAFWSHNVRSVLKHGLAIDYDFFHCDIQKRLQNEHLEAIKKSKLFTFVKFISAIQNQSGSRKSFQAIFDAAPSGSCFLILDNSQPQIKNYVEKIIFPNHQFTQHSNYKENEKYRMFTSYAEYRFDISNIAVSNDNICRLLTLVMEWVERPPLVDIRIYVFLIQKK